MEKARVLTIAGLTLIFALLLTAEAYGGATVATVWTTDVDEVPKETFILGEEVYIHWTANGMVNITAYYESGDVDEEWTNLGKSGTVSFTPRHGGGYYTINCTSTDMLDQGRFVYATIHVIPEFLFGTIGGVGGLSGALALFGMLKRRRKRAG